ncbi:hypothetical protein MDA_GLEAN10003634 [Myotis davidii]|uniref:Uncharacterized protein n=1 Tax=Myotis davidii TaxID=225400 RepID=L5LWS7_MYODS|nr:hypothetical protein MDA_GLEAN10003634 [Myotis davidii]
MPLAAQEPSGDVYLPAGNRPKLQSDILSTAEEVGEAPPPTTVLAAISLAPALSICPLVEQGEVEKTSWTIGASSRCLHPLMAPSDQNQHRVLAAGVSKASTSSRCERWLLAPIDPQEQEEVEKP